MDGESLRNIFLFAGLSAEDLDRLSQMVEEKHLPASRTLFWEGTPGEWVYFIKEGKVELYKMSAEGQILLATRHAGELIGEMALLDAGPRTASARTTTKTVLLAISQTQFNHLLDSSPTAARSILRILMPRWRETEAVLKQSQQIIKRQSQDLSQALSELQKTNQDLERRVQHRAIELAEANRHLQEQIAEREQTEAALRESEELFRVITEISPVPLLISRVSDGAVLYANPQFADTFGLAMPEVIGCTTPDFYYNLDDRKRLLKRLTKHNQVQDYELQAKKADGTPFWVTISIQSLTFKGEAAWLTALHDITKHKQAEYALQVYHSHLQKEVAKRTTELTAINRQLQQEIADRETIEQALSQQNDYLAALHDITLGLVSRLELNELLETLVQRAVQLLHTEHGFVYLVEPTVNELEIKVGLGYFSEHIGHRLKPNMGLSGKVWQTGQPMVARNYESWEGRAPNFPCHLFGTIAGIPLKNDSQVVGVLGVAYAVDSKQGFEGKKVDLLSRFGQLASVALDNAQLYQTARREKQFFEAMVLNSPVAIITANLDNQIMSWNPAAEALFGYTEAEVIGYNMNELLTATPSLQTEAQYVTDRVMTGQVVQVITQRSRRDGSCVDVELFGVPVMIDGNMVAIFGIYHDISELQQARQAAEAASRAKSAFIANVSHEFRTPLTSVLGFAKMIQRKLDERIFPAFEHNDQKLARLVEQVSQNIIIIITEAERLSSLINNILDLAEIESGQVDWYMQPLMLVSLINQAVVATSNLLSLKDVELITEVEDNLPYIKGDQQRLVQVLTNLLLNAINFTYEGHIICRAEQVDDQIIISVNDTGIGIAEADQPRVFEKFNQIGDILTNKPRGTGLGLSICKEIVEHHQGRIWVDSQLGKGSTFSFSLPIMKGS